MKKGLITLLIIVALLLIGGCQVKGIYNGFVTSQESVDGQWGQVENVYQRRADLIPNLVETVKGYASHERETLEAVIKARAEATKVQAEITPETLNTPGVLEKFQSAQGELSSALGRLMVVIERYPDLKANQGFLDLQTQLEGTENRIATERRRFNEVVREYNIKVRRFPANFVAGIFNFDERPYFEAAEGADQAPQVEF